MHLKLARGVCHSSRGSLGSLALRTPVATAVNQMSANFLSEVADDIAGGEGEGV